MIAESNVIEYLRLLHFHLHSHGFFYKGEVQDDHVPLHRARSRSGFSSQYACPPLSRTLSDSRAKMGKFNRAR